MEHTLWQSCAEKPSHDFTAQHLHLVTVISTEALACTLVKQEIEKGVASRHRTAFILARMKRCFAPAPQPLLPQSQRRRSKTLRNGVNAAKHLAPCSGVFRSEGVREEATKQSALQLAKELRAKRLCTTRRQHIKPHRKICMRARPPELRRRYLARRRSSAHGF
jgi:hypothetical protein